MDRDLDAFPEMIRMAAELYDIDTSRVYLTGFSNGAVITREVGAAYPQCFAAISPWNGPGLDSITLYEVGTAATGYSPAFSAVVEQFQRGGWELPGFFYYGDRDNKVLPQYDAFPQLLRRANRCGDAPPERLAPPAGCAQGERFDITGYRGPDGQVRVAVTMMRDMPHGAIDDESRACWEQLRHFRRPAGSRTVEYLP